MPYHVQAGDTIAQVTKMLNISWQRLKELNPQAVNRCTLTGNWFLRQGAAVTGEQSFSHVLEAIQAKGAVPTTTEQSTQVNAAAPPAAEQSAPPREAPPYKEYTVREGDTLWSLAVKRFHVNLEDLIKDNHITDPSKLQPGETIRVRESSFPAVQKVVASWYGEPYHGRTMANGEVYNMNAATIAHRDLPFGTKVELKNPATGQTARAVVTDRGPFIEGRDVDLSYGLAKKLSLVKKGVGKLVMRILPHRPPPLDKRSA